MALTPDNLPGLASSNGHQINTNQNKKENPHDLDFWDCDNCIPSNSFVGTRLFIERMINLNGEPMANVWSLSIIQGKEPVWKLVDSYHIDS